MTIGHRLLQPVEHVGRAHCVRNTHPVLQGTHTMASNALRRHIAPKRCSERFVEILERPRPVDLLELLGHRCCQGYVASRRWACDATSAPLRFRHSQW